MEAGERYTSRMGQSPVINLTLKSAKQNTFASAYFKIREALASEFQRHRFLLEKERLLENEKEKFKKIMMGEAEFDEYSGALKFLSECLLKYTGCVRTISDGHGEMAEENIGTVKSHN